VLKLLSFWLLCISKLWSFLFCQTLRGSDVHMDNDSSILNECTTQQEKGKRVWVNEMTVWWKRWPLSLRLSKKSAKLWYLSINLQSSLSIGVYGDKITKIEIIIRVLSSYRVSQSELLLLLLSHEQDNTKLINLNYYYYYHTNKITRN